MTLIYSLYAGEKKSKKISLYIRFVNDCLRVSYLSIPSTPFTQGDLHRLPPKSAKKARKTGKVPVGDSQIHT